MTLAPVPEHEFAETLEELEAIIFAGLDTFLDVATALLKVKMDRRYREIGYSSFEDYCERRVGISRRRGYQLITAAATAESLARSLRENEDEVCTTVHTLPTNERQVRPLAALPSPEAKAEAWTEAVESAGGEQPTAAQVEAVVDRRRITPEVERKMRDDLAAKAPDLAAQVETGTLTLDEARAADHARRRKEIDRQRDALAWIDSVITYLKPPRGDDEIEAMNDGLLTRVGEPLDVERITSLRRAHARLTDLVERALA